jgi:nitrate reductase gamma subunit
MKQTVNGTLFDISLEQTKYNNIVIRCFSSSSSSLSPSFFLFFVRLFHLSIFSLPFLFFFFFFSPARVEQD